MKRTVVHEEVRKMHGSTVSKRTQSRHMTMYAAPVF
jgi:hypothetical protein